MHHGSSVWQQVLRQWLGITQLEERMSATENAIADLNAATNEVAAELDELRNQLASTDQATADQLGQVAARLRGLAADPENPVPDPPADPQPVDPEPTPDEPNF
jgi:hypothetical protein